MSKDDFKITRGGSGKDHVERKWMGHYTVFKDRRGEGDQLNWNCLIEFVLKVSLFHSFLTF